MSYASDAQQAEQSVGSILESWWGLSPYKKLACRPLFDDHHLPGSHPALRRFRYVRRPSLSAQIHYQCCTKTTIATIQEVLPRIRIDDNERAAICTFLLERKLGEANVYPPYPVIQHRGGLHCLEIVMQRTSEVPHASFLHSNFLQTIRQETF